MPLWEVVQNDLRPARSHGNIPPGDGAVSAGAAGAAAAAGTADCGCSSRWTGAVAARNTTAPATSHGKLDVTLRALMVINLHCFHALPVT